MAACALLGGMSLANAKPGAVHSLARVSGGIAHVPHGIACAAAARTRLRDQRAGDAVRAGLPACR
jgi:alcohol dehydrogenase class IV